MINNVLKSTQSGIQAHLNTLSLVRLDAALPGKVFQGEWGKYLFLPSDWVFDELFAAFASKFTALNGASVVCFSNITNFISSGKTQSDEIYFDNSIEPARYREVLSSRGAPVSWLQGVDSFVCASDKENWCTYCERENDIAVMAFQDEASFMLAKSLLRSISAKTIDEILMDEDAADFPLNALTPAWKLALRINYGE